MSKKTTGKEVVVGAAILGLLTGGTAMASTRGIQNGRFFEVKELKAGYELAKNDKDDAHKVKTEKACNAKSCKGKSCKGKDCKDKSCKDKDCKDKSCKGKDNKKTDKDCGENSCGSKDGKKSK